ncbi:hypothetical protein NRIC_03710 [Enterococcus florum]|uniref:HTH cro/C1-type domain-containing protein n=1 Tax=Enterococcus florum TaxID=2480627 RepID=A0A4P5P4D0_9ENTE|nr:helix-turn-helix transcriptional regulator [Enterococcus florum]GCF92480.1 hypothetical protein NRIC_03710 [Enterococcus florum]
MINNKLPSQVFWENVERYRKEKGISRAKLEDAAKLTKGYIGTAITAGSFPGQQIIQRIAHYLKLQYVDLFEDWDD